MDHIDSLVSFSFSLQFESGKRGYIDDFELALVQPGKVLVRSSSRIGYLDFGVNAKVSK